MKYKDYYDILGVPRTATEAEIKGAYRKLARKYHPDVSKESDAESRFKEIGEAYQVLKEPDKRAAYDNMGTQWQGGQDFQPPPNWDAGFEFTGRGGNGGDFSDFFESMFGGQAGGARGRARRPMHAQGEDHHAKVLIDLEDAYRGASRNVTLRMPTTDASGRVTTQERTLSVNIPKGVREGQHLRLSGQGSPGIGQGQPGDLYLEIAFRPHRLFRVDERDVYVDLPLAPWEAALGATVDIPTPDGSVQLTIPPNTSAGRKLRLKGKGLPSNPAGDLYVVVGIALPPADTPEARDAYAAMQKAFHFNPRAGF
ncbi:DnaJ C-terminal domain-containing protein [Pigmentiphaga litoralis]|uniref:DnaJ C-terminal domain-containing protein n=1 Tax=Pigmentiphaga litoralis TaxID=516702 RepID=UPI003B42ABCE